MSNQNFTQEDSNNNRSLGIIISIFTFLFFLPYVMKDKDSVYLKFRANQSLLIFILDAVLGFVAGIFRAIPLIGWIPAAAIGLISFAFAVVNIVNAAQEENTGKPLPIIGYIEILK